MQQNIQGIPMVLFMLNYVPIAVHQVLGYGSKCTYMVRSRSSVKVT